MTEPSLIPIDPNNPSLEPSKKKRGAPIGNKNALKHGLFIHGNYLHNLTPLEKAQLCDTSSLIEHFKKSMERLYEISLNSKDIFELNGTLRSMALAAQALTRLLYAQEEHSKFWLTTEYRTRAQDTSTRHSFIKGLMKNVKGIVDLTELKEMIEEDDQRRLEQLAASSNPAPEDA